MAVVLFNVDAFMVVFSKYLEILKLSKTMVNMLYLINFQSIEKLLNSLKLWSIYYIQLDKSYLKKYSNN